MVSDNLFRNIEFTSNKIIQSGDFNGNNGLGSLSFFLVLLKLVMGNNEALLHEPFSKFIGTKRYPILTDENKNNCSVNKNYETGIFSNLVHYFRVNDHTTGTLKLSSKYFFKNSSNFVFTNKFYECSAMLFIGKGKEDFQNQVDYTDKLQAFINQTDNHYMGITSVTIMEYLGEDSALQLSFVNKLSYIQEWQNNFSLTSNKQFTNKSGAKVSIPYMMTTQEMHMLELDTQFTMIAVPFKSVDNVPDMHMVLVIPKDGNSIEKLIKETKINFSNFLPPLFDPDAYSLNNEKINGLYSWSSQKESINLLMPKIKVIIDNDIAIPNDTELNFLNEILNINKNFANMFTVDSQSQSFKSPTFKERLYIEISERGSGIDTSRQVEEHSRVVSRQESRGSSTKIEINKGFTLMIYSHRLRHHVLQANILNFSSMGS